MTQSQLNNIH